MIYLCILTPRIYIRGLIISRIPEEIIIMEDFMYTLKREYFTTRTMVKVSIMAVIALVLMALEFPLWFAPAFLQFDLSDVPALIGSFAMGPMAGVIIQFLKNILKIIFLGSGTAGVGELANFVVGSIFVYSAGFIYYRNKTKKSAVIGLVVGTVLMTIIISIINYSVMFPFYAKAFGMPLDNIIEMGSQVNKFVTDYKTLIVFAVVPFNLLKGILVSIVTMLLYKRVSPILSR